MFSMRFAKILIFTLLRLSYGLAIDDCDKTFDYDVLEYIDPLIGSAKEGTYNLKPTSPAPESRLLTLYQEMSSLAQLSPTAWQKP